MTPPAFVHPEDNKYICCSQVHIYLLYKFGKKTQNFKPEYNKILL